MKPEERRNLLILIIVGAIIIGALVMKNRGNNDVNPEEKEIKEEYVQVLDDGTKLNVSEELKEAKKIDGLEITNIQLTQKGGQTVLLADVTNPTAQEVGATGIYIIILDRKGNEIGKIPGVISPLKVGETKQLNVGVTDDYANAYDFKVEKQ